MRLSTYRAPLLTAVLALTFALPGLLATAATAHAGSPVGVWKTIDDETGKPKSHVKIWEKNGKLYGKVIKLLNLKPDADQDPKCTKCTGSRKDKPIIGMMILWDLVQDDDEWEDGTILDPEKGETYDCSIWLEGNSKLKVRGYWGIFYRTQTWHRVQ